MLLLELSLTTLKKEAEHIIADIKKDKSHPKNYAVIPVFFSDSILLVSGSDDWFSGLRLILAAESIMSAAFALRIPIKGAVAYGQQTADTEHSLYFGRPLIDAYDLQEQLMMYGLVLHHTAEQAFTKAKVNDDETAIQALKNLILVEYKTPLRNGQVRHWTNSWNINRPAPSLEEVIRAFYQTVSGDTRRYVDNTLDFAQYLAQRKKEQKSG